MLASPLTPSTSGSPFPPEGSHASGGGNSYKGHLMTGLFAENFWGDTDQYYQGFETLAKHMRQGRKETVEVIAFIKERIAIEEEYAKRLSKLSKVPLDTEGFDAPKLSEDQMDTTLKTAFKHFKEATDNLATRHRLLADDLNKFIYKPLENYKESQKKEVTEAIAVVEKSQKEYASHRVSLPKLKKAYISKCEELEVLKAEIEAAGGMNSKDKRVEKLLQKHAKLQKDIDVADAAYQQGVPKLEASRLSWEEVVTETCHQFEGAETDRINKLKDLLTEFVNIYGRLHETTAKMIENQRIYTACIKSEIDIEFFVSLNRTGSTRPGTTIYANFYTGLMKDIIFGVSLGAHLETTGRTVPLLLEKCMAVIEKNGLQDEGIYRLSGRLAKVRHLRAQFDKKDGASTDLENDPDVQVNDVASLLKLYLRELPEPLLTFELYDDMIAAVTIGDDAKRAQELKTIVDKLPLGNKSTLQALLVHLRKVAAEDQVNKMSVSNLAIVFGPCLVRSRNESAALKDFRTQSKLVEHLIQQYPQMFP